jgi:predicted RNA-binding Zn-ribbon protein involved in translation (DUF1610 family)
MYISSLERLECGRIGLGWHEREVCDDCGVHWNIYERGNLKYCPGCGSKKSTTKLIRRTEKRRFFVSTYKWEMKELPE